MNLFLQHIRWGDWRAPIMSCLQGSFEPCSNKGFKRITQRTRNYVIHKDELYKSRISIPWLKCIPSWQGMKVYKLYTKDFADHILAPKPWLAMPSDRVCFGPRSSKMLMNLESLLKESQQPEGSLLSFATYHSIMTIAEMGHRPCRGTPHDSRKL